MPWNDALTLLSSLRQKQKDTHVLILTAKDTLEDRIIGLNLGADDYLVKPFAFEELLARVHAMQTMVENLLTLAKADAGHLTLRKDMLDLTDFASECWRPFDERAEERGLQVRLPDTTNSITVATDREKLRLVLHNLFDNAVRHADQGGEVTVDVVQATKMVIFEVRNTGCALSPTEVKNAFDRFWKHDAARSEGSEHCGLGLPLCRKVIEVLGGSISATAEGHTFAVRLTLPDEKKDE